MAPYDARAVANFLLDYAASKGSALTQLSLLKLAFFCHGWYLSRFGGPLIDDDFEAWEKGPVVRTVRDCFSKFGKGPISTRAHSLNIFTGQVTAVPPLLEELDANFVRAVFDRYYVFDAWQLSEMTHRRGSPWDQLWNSKVPIARVGMRIHNKDIKAYFDALSRNEMLS